MDKQTQKTLMSSGRQDWATPQELIDAIEKELGLPCTLDLAATQANKKAEYWIGPDSPYVQDLLVPNIVDMVKEAFPPAIYDGFWWCNPPYGRAVTKFVDAWKRLDSGDYKSVRTCSYAPPIVCLPAARTDTAWFHKLDVDSWVSEIRLLRGRIQFEGAAHPAPFPSALIFMGIHPRSGDGIKLRNIPGKVYTARRRKRSPAAAT